MLILPDSSSLGDTHLSPAENVEKLKEGIRQTVSRDRMPNQTLLEDKDMSLGAAMAPKQFIQKLQKMNPAILVEPGGVPGAVAVRIRHLDDDVESPTRGTYVKKYITGFFTDSVIPEFSNILPDKWGRATREIRGWRSVLLALLKAGALTYPQIKAVFGEPLGQRNVLWREQTQQERA